MSIRCRTIMLRVWVCLCFFMTWVNGQELAFRHYGTKDGLPSAEVYDILQDRQGFMWFATDMGVARFDGYTFEVFTTDNGLPDNTVFKMYLDSHNRIWFGCYNQRLCYFENEAFHAYPYNQLLLDAIHNKSLLLVDLLVDDQDAVHVGVKARGYFKISKDGVMVKEVTTLPEVMGYCVQTEKGMLSTGFDNADIEKTIKYVSCLLISANRFNYQHCVRVMNDAKLYSEPVKSVISGDTVCLVSHVRKLMRCTEKGCIEVAGNYQVLDMGMDHRRNIWMSTIDSGVYRMKSPYQPGVWDHWLDGESITGVTMDVQGGMWFATVANGVYYLPDEVMHARRFETSGKSKGRLIASDQQHMYVVGEQGDVEVLNENGDIQRSMQISLSKSMHIRYLAGDTACRKLFCWGHGNACYIQNFKIRYLAYFPHITDLLCWHDTVTAVGPGGIIHLVDDSIYRFGFQQKEVPAITSMAMATDRSMLLGSLEGLYGLVDNTPYFIGGDDERLHARIVKMQTDRNGITWMATKGAGLLGYRDSVIYHYDVSNGLCSNLLTDVKVDQGGDIWVSSFSGVNRIRPEGKPEVLYLSNANGLVSNTVLGLATIKNKIWILSEQGLNWFDADELLPDTLNAPIVFRGLKVNGASKPCRSGLELNPEENSIEITFAALDFRQAGVVRYRYRINGEQDSWSYTSQNTIHYERLPSGKYTFEVSAQNQSGVWSPSSPFQLSISPYFYDTLWFRLLLILVLAGSVGWYVYSRFRRLAWKNSIRNDLTQFQMQALSAQMNPHFIFNSLSSIQHFVMQHDERASNRYISRFARLMRLILDNSQKTMIPLESELEALEIYLELESMRFNQGFDYAIQVDPSVKPTDVRVPSLFLQPYVENAIWHGLMPKTEKGKLSIKIYKVNKVVYCEIEDNGVGRHASVKTNREKRPGHTSHGTVLSEKRLHLLNRTTRNSFSCEFIDLLNEQGNPAGTKVVLTFSEIN
ncbi:MAG: histidine kinase [Flavobacteriales bacterium]|nr:histidine kinase [Flavobacteriales bacterium]